jgi:hypothetical protein
LAIVFIVLYFRKKFITAMPINIVVAVILGIAVLVIIGVICSLVANRQESSSIDDNLLMTTHDNNTRAVQGKQQHCFTIGNTLFPADVNSVSDGVNIVPHDEYTSVLVPVVFDSAEVFCVHNSVVGVRNGRLVIVTCDEPTRTTVTDAHLSNDVVFVYDGGHKLLCFDATRNTIVLLDTSTFEMTGTIVVHVVGMPVWSDERVLVMTHDPVTHTLTGRVFTDTGVDVWTSEPLQITGNIEHAYVGDDRTTDGERYSIVPGAVAGTSQHNTAVTVDPNTNTVIIASAVPGHRDTTTNKPVVLPLPHVDHRTTVVISPALDTTSSHVTVRALTPHERGVRLTALPIWSHDNRWIANLKNTRIRELVAIDESIDLPLTTTGEHGFFSTVDTTTTDSGYTITVWYKHETGVQIFKWSPTNDNDAVAGREKRICV